MHSHFYEARSIPIGRTEDELAPWADDSTRRNLVAGVEAGSVRALDVGVRTAEGHTLACLLSADTVFINGQACVLSVVQDVSDRRHPESELVDAIESVMQDTTWFSRSVVERLANLRVARDSQGLRRRRRQGSQGVGQRSDRQSHWGQEDPGRRRCRKGGWKSGGGTSARSRTQCATPSRNDHPRSSR